MSGWAFVIGMLVLGLCLDHGMANIARAIVVAARSRDEEEARSEP